MHWFFLILLIPYIYIFLKIFRNLLKIEPYSASDHPSAQVSVLIACRNEENNLLPVLNDLSSQDYSTGLFEVIIVDDNSTDMTFDAASGFRGIKNIRVLKNSGTGKKKAIRTGAGLATGTLIITTDADCRMKRNRISTIASFYEKNRPEMIICPVVMNGGPGFFHKFQELEFLSLQGITAGCAVAGDPVMCNGANLAYTRESFNKHSEDLHDELVSGDDVFLLHSIKKENPGKVLWLESQNAIVSTVSSPTLASFLKQRTRWISKAGAYKDISTKILAIVTLGTTLLQLFLLIAGIFYPDFLLVFMAVFLLKSLPDFMIIMNTASRYGKKNLMKWFPISQFVYPFYVIAVISSFLSGKAGSPNSPYPKGI